VPNVPPPGYGAPYGAGAAPGYPGSGGTNGFAVASLVLGIIGGTFCLVWIAALVFGYRARDQIRRSGGTEGGAGMATAGIVLGWIWAAFGLLYFGWFAVALATAGS
jgi:hypothetical protein